MTWFPEFGIGYFPVKLGNDQYDKGYFHRYAELAATDLGEALMEARADLVETFIGPREMVDVGIGSGAFIETRNKRYGDECTKGYDVNPAGESWLMKRGLYSGVYDVAQAPFNISLWDVLEHIHNPERLLRNVRERVFVSIPIFTGPDHVLRSKHFRKDEHVWYFTARGLVAFFEAMGFRCELQSDMESKIGREDIGTFVFARGDAKRTTGTRL